MDGVQVGARGRRGADGLLLEGGVRRVEGQAGHLLGGVPRQVHQQGVVHLQILQGKQQIVKK